MGVDTRWFVSRDSKLYEALTKVPARGKVNNCEICDMSRQNEGGCRNFYKEGFACSNIGLVIHREKIYFKEITNG